MTKEEINGRLKNLLREPNKERFEKKYKSLVEKNKQFVEEGKKSQVPRNETLLRRFTI